MSLNEGKELSVVTEGTDPYAEVGVSATKKGVHEATKNLPKGLYPGAFCKILPMPSSLPLGVVNKYVQIIHSDGVGTKSNVAYLAKVMGLPNYLDYFRALPQDALVMNTDDMACVGVIGEDIYISNHIARNANRISDTDIAEIIRGYSDFFNLMGQHGINLVDAGGETADVGSYTTTMGLDVTAVATIEKSKVIDCANIKPGQIIVGLASAGQCSYEKKYNSGIRSNGLTLAINALLSPYFRRYTEAMDLTIAKDKVFGGCFDLTDKLPGTSLTVAEALLSPTRTYLPVLKKIIEKGTNISGMIHCSGGGLTKSINFGNNIRYVKNNLIEIPPMFQVIKNVREIDDRYMFQTFNNGTGMEIIVPNVEDAAKIIMAAKEFNIEAKIIGYTEASLDMANEVVIEHGGKVLTYKK